MKMCFLIGHEIGSVAPKPAPALFLSSVYTRRISLYRFLLLTHFDWSFNRPVSEAKQMLVVLLSRGNLFETPEGPFGSH